MMADEYALEKLKQAVEVLASGSGRVQERLADAAIFLIRLRREDISDEELRRTFIGVIDDLSYAKAQGEEGRIPSVQSATSLAAFARSNGSSGRAMSLRHRLRIASDARTFGLPLWQCWSCEGFSAIRLIGFGRDKLERKQRLSCPARSVRDPKAPGFAARKRTSCPVS